MDSPVYLLGRGCCRHGLWPDRGRRAPRRRPQAIRGLCIPCTGRSAAAVCLGGRVTGRRSGPCRGKSGGLQPRRRGGPCPVSRPRSVARHLRAVDCRRPAGARGRAPPRRRSSRWRDGLEPGRDLSSPTGRSSSIVLLGRRQRPSQRAIGRSSLPLLTLDGLHEEEKE